MMLNELASCTIALSFEDIGKVDKYARIRRSESKNCRDRMVSSKSWLFVDTIGVMGELALCRYLGIPYCFTVNTFRRADVLGHIEVRATEWENGHCKVRPDDEDSRRVVMAVVRKPRNEVYLPGWVIASDAKRFPLRDPHNANMPMHFVPQSELCPMSKLKDSLTSGIDNSLEV